MSVGYYIVLDSDDPGFETFVSGKALARAIGVLDAICEQEGLATFGRFMGQSMNEFADLLGEDLDVSESETGEAMWFEPNEGINLIDVLGEKIRANPRVLSFPDMVLEDLAEYRRVLVQAEAIGAKWHLALDI